MKEKKEFLSTLCTIYLIFIVAAVPLYTGGEFYAIGDNKYTLFRNVSVFVCILWILVEGVTRIRIWGQKEDREKTSLPDRAGKFLLLYLAGVTVSVICSRYRDTALWGYAEWHMGALAQILFVGAYFLAALYYDGNRIIPYVGTATVAIINLLGLLNRLGIDPLGMYIGFAHNSWEYSHLLSTIGNINWFSGYMSLAMAMPLMGYWRTWHKDRKIIFGAVNIAGLTMLLIQGSDTGIIGGLLWLVLPAIFRKDRRILKDQLALATGTAFGVAVMGLLVRLSGSMDATPIDGPARTLLKWGGFWAIGALLLVWTILEGRYGEKKRSYIPGNGMRIPKPEKKTIVVLAGVLAVLLSAAVWIFLEKGMLADSWGNDRGALWKLAWRGFRDGNLLQKLFGAGPDCFAEYMRELTPMGSAVSAQYHWSGVTYANAHNEFLNQLVNTGLFGTLAYMGFFLSVLFGKNTRTESRILVIVYLVNALFSFQQVLNASMVFVLLGCLGGEGIDKGIGNGVQSIR